MRAAPSLPNQTGACSTSLVKSHSATARIETLQTPLPAPPPIKPNKDAHGGEYTSRKPRGAKAENGHVWINLQRQISGGIKASCIHTYLAPPLLPRGADTCHACNKWSNQPRGATMATAIGEGEADNTALPLRQILLTAWTWLPLLPISLDTRTDRGNLIKRPPRLPAILAHTIL